MPRSQDDESGGYVCCRPIEFMIESDGQTLMRIDTYTDDESVMWTKVLKYN